MDFLFEIVIEIELTAQTNRTHEGLKSNESEVTSHAIVLTLAETRGLALRLYQIMPQLSRKHASEPQISEMTFI